MKKEIVSIDSLNLNCQYAYNENRGNCWAFDGKLKDLDIRVRMVDDKRNIFKRALFPKLFYLNMHVLFFVYMSVNKDIQVNEAEFIAIDTTDGNLYKVFYEYELIEPPDDHFFFFDRISKEQMLEYAEEYAPESADRLKKYKYEDFEKFLDLQYISDEDMELFG